MDESSPIPGWLHELYEHKHLERVILTLAKRERSRDAARAQSRRYHSGSRKDKISGKLNTVLLAAPSQTGEKAHHYSVSVGNLRENQQANRYLNLEPYDRTRVVVGEGAQGHLDSGSEGSNDGRYLNANWVRELGGGKWWIATQAPLPNTAHAFLSVILQPVSQPPPDLHPAAERHPTRTTRVRTVVQLTPTIERGMRKAHVYFPPECGQSWIIEPEPGHSAPDLRVTLLSQVSHSESECVQSTVEIAPQLHPGDSGLVPEPVIFQHLLYGAWPDHGVPGPDERAGLLEFVRLVDRVNRDRSSQPVPPDTLDPDPPVMVGCSAGIGRTGSFIAISSLMRTNGLLPPPEASLPPDQALPPLPPSPLGQLPSDLEADPIAREIDSLREQRPGMVQREEQIILIYEALALAFAQQAGSGNS